VVNAPVPGRRVRAWWTAPVLTVALLSVASGVAAFGVTAVIGDVAGTFGQPVGDEAGLGAIGLPVTTVGVALAVVRFASLGSLPLSALADRRGRRRTLLAAAVIGLGFTLLAAASPGFWWYVALVALARPALSTLNALAGVVAAEESSHVDRSASVALITAAYGVGAGIVSVARGLLPGQPSFRVVMAFSLIPLVLLPLLSRRIREPAVAVDRTRARGLPGSVPAALVGRVTVISLMVGCLALATGPGFTYLFVYGERVLGATPLAISGLVLAAGPAGLAGLLIGRWGADRLGRRVTAAVAMAGAGVAVAVAYSGGFSALAVGYLASIALSSAFAPAEGSLGAELVPTAARATLAGWMTVAGVLGAVVGLTAFGVLADVTGRFSTTAWLVGAVVAVSALGFAALPETRGVELEDLEADATGT